MNAIQVLKDARASLHDTDVAAAVNRAAGRDLASAMEAKKVLHYLACSFDCQCLPEWSDRKGRTQAEAVALMDRAISMMEAA